MNIDSLIGVGAIVGALYLCFGKLVIKIINYLSKPSYESEGGGGLEYE